MSNLSPENDDIRFQPVLAIFCMKNSYGLKFDRRPFFKLFSQVLKVDIIYTASASSQAQISPTKTNYQMIPKQLQLNLFNLFEN